MTSTATAPARVGDDEATSDQVLDRASGELLDIREAPTERLARFLEDIAELAGQLDEARSAVEREVLSAWTPRPPGPRWPAPSSCRPQAPRPA